MIKPGRRERTKRTECSQPLQTKGPEKAKGCDDRNLRNKFNLRILKENKLAVTHVEGNLSVVVGGSGAGWPEL